MGVSEGVDKELPTISLRLWGSHSQADPITLVVTERTHKLGEPHGRHVGQHGVLWTLPPSLNHKPRAPSQESSKKNINSKPPIKILD